MKKAGSSLFMLAIIGVMATGCASKYVGTWQSIDDEASNFSIGGMTLAPDGTYTAFANYGGTSRGFTGHWTIEDDELVLENTDRSYGLSMDGDMLVLTDKSTETQAKMKRAD